jgi:hypothetical protein
MGGLADRPAMVVPRGGGTSFITGTGLPAGDWFPAR